MVRGGMKSQALETKSNSGGLHHCSETGEIIPVTKTVQWIGAPCMAQFPSLPFY